MGILLNLNLNQGIKVIIYLHTFFSKELFWKFFWNFLDDLYAGMFMDRRNFLGGIFWADFFGGFFLRNFWADFFGRNVFLKELFGRNYFFTLLKLFEYERD